MNEIIDNIANELFSMQDLQFQSFNSKLIPTIPSELIIGVRTPRLRAYSKKLFKSQYRDVFLNFLPHKYLEENNLHMYLLEQIKDFDECISRTEEFLPYIDNWSTCDVPAPKIFAKYKTELLGYIHKWIKSNHEYTIRYAIGLLMSLFLDESFDPVYIELVASVRSEKYYVNMMIAWYFATALAKQYDCAVKYIQQQKLQVFTHNKTIQKAVESFRILPERKAYLKTLKIKIK